LIAEASEELRCAGHESKVCRDRIRVTAKQEFSMGDAARRRRSLAHDEPTSAVSPRLGQAASSELGLSVADCPPRDDALDFEHIYGAHFDFVWRSLRLLGVSNEALEDAAQDTFSVVHRQLSSFEGRSALRTWLFAILYRVAANYRRTRRRKYSRLIPFDDAAGAEPAPDAHAEAAEAARLIERFCAGLAPARRALFVLAVLEELPAPEVAQALGMPVQKIYSRVHALRAGLRSALAAREVEHG
jgi:RNA polymerase sigma-70 factor (ECF subfamily)